MPPLRITGGHLMIRRELVVELDVPPRPADPLLRVHVQVRGGASRAGDARRVGLSERILGKKGRRYGIDLARRNDVSGEWGTRIRRAVLHRGERVVNDVRRRTGLPSQ